MKELNRFLVVPLVCIKDADAVADAGFSVGLLGKTHRLVEIVQCSKRITARKIRAADIRQIIENFNLKLTCSIVDSLISCK